MCRYTGAPFRAQRNYSRNSHSSPSSKLAPQEHPPSPCLPLHHHPNAATSACHWLQLFGRICTRGKYFTPYELLSAGPVLSSEEIDRLFTALRGRGSAETGMMARWREVGGALSPIRSFVTSNRQFTMREFFQFIHSAVTAVFYLHSKLQSSPPTAKPPQLCPPPTTVWRCGAAGSAPRACADTAVQLLSFSAPRGRRR